MYDELQAQYQKEKKNWESEKEKLTTDFKKQTDTMREKIKSDLINKLAD